MSVVSFHVSLGVSVVSVHISFGISVVSVHSSGGTIICINGNLVDPTIGEPAVTPIGCNILSIMDVARSTIGEGKESSKESFSCNP